MNILTFSTRTMAPLLVVLAAIAFTFMLLPTNQASAQVPTGTLQVIKMVVGTTTVDESNFSFKLDGGATTTFETDGTNTFTLATGTYDVVETSAPAYTTTYSDGTNADCTDVVVTTGSTSTCTITNTLIPPPIALSCSIAADDVDISAGSDVTLTWSSIDALTASLSVAGAVATSGSLLVENVDSDTTYTLTVTDDVQNQATCSVAVDTRSSGGGGSGGSNRTPIGDRDNDDDDDNDNNDNDDDDDGEVRGDSDDADGQVLGDQVSTVPTGAPNAGAGGTSNSVEFSSFASVALLSRTRKHG